MSQLISGYEQLSEFGLYTISVDLNRFMFDYVFRANPGDGEESLTSSEAKKKLFNLCLSLNFNSLSLKQKTNDFLVEILDKYLFQSDFDLRYFKSEILQWALKRNEFVIKYLLDKLTVSFYKSIGLLVSLIEFMGSDKHIRKNYGSKIVHFLYENWELFRPYWTIESSIENKQCLVNLLTKSILIESVQLGKFKDVSEMYMTLLIDPNTKLNFKCKLLDLLYFFADSPAPFHLKKYLGQFIAQFPLKSNELVEGDDLFNDYLNAIRKILVSLEMSSSIDLLNLIVNVCCREQDHLCDSEIQSCLIRFVKRLECSRQALIIKQYWEMSLGGLNTNENDERKFLIFRKILFNFLTNCDRLIFVDFMCLNISFLIGVLDVELRENNFEQNCLNKKCVFEVIELAYKRLHKDEIFFANAKLCVAFERAKFGNLNYFY